MTDERFNEIYSDLTGVDIEEQKKIWDERGKGYYGEYLVFKKLFFNIDGCAKFLMNVNLPTDGENTTELDLIMIHETGIYVFEVKHYKGTIYGSEDDETWTQYFRTTKNSVFKNPILQNKYHIDAVKRLFPYTPVHSMIVFTSDECELKVDTETNVCLLRGVLDVLEGEFSFYDNKLEMDDIEAIFEEIEYFSPIRETNIPDDSGNIVPFYQYINGIKSIYNDTMKLGKEDLRSQAINLRKKWVKFSLTTVLVCVLISFFCFCVVKSDCNKRIERSERNESHTRSLLSSAIAKRNELENAMKDQAEEYEREIRLLEAKMNKVDLSDEDNRKIAEEMIKVSSGLKKVKGLTDAVEFSCKLTNTAEEYGIMFNENTAFIVMLRDGSVQEYEMFGERLKYSTLGIRISGTKDKITYPHTKNLVPLEIYNIKDVNDIEYIKITNISLWKWGYNQNKPVSNGLELEVYSK